MDYHNLMNPRRMDLHWNKGWGSISFALSPRPTPPGSTLPPWLPRRLSVATARASLLPCIPIYMSCSACGPDARFDRPPSSLRCFISVEAFVVSLGLRCNQ
uniref:Uncharacterized protein n=1 Tax=Physcomitrium patens TaxID=3218 RepID=A0A2K1J4U6_PHYPA|nr:hypothetical protein PHYPA_022402 [Physcomitrium patens]